MNRNHHNFQIDDDKVFLSHSELSDKLISDFIPIALTTTLLAPINRVKICLQTISMMSINRDEKTFRPRDLARKIIKEQGFFSFWRGNTANLYRLLSQNFANIMINTKINNHIKQFTKSEKNYLNRLISTSISSSICLFFSYPFDLAHTRISADMTRYGHKKLNSSVVELFTKLVVEEEALSKSSLSNMGMKKLYKGFSVAMMSNILYWTLTLSLFDKLHYYFDNKKAKYGSDFEYLSFTKKIFVLFGATTLNGILTSVIIYPLDTFKRQLQVNSALGFKSEYYSLSDGIKKFSAEGFLNMYRGFSMNLCKVIPFTFLQYTFYSSINTQNKS